MPNIPTWFPDGRLLLLESLLLLLEAAADAVLLNSDPSTFPAAKFPPPMLKSRTGTGAGAKGFTL